MTKIIAEKQILRKFFKEKRAELTSLERDNLSKLICENFIKFFTIHADKFKNSNFGSYVPTKFEANPRYIEDFLVENNCQISYPKIQEQSTVLKFFKKTSQTILTPNETFRSIREPSHGAIIEPDFLLVPLLAFDSNLQRLGMGKGYYDTTIFYYKNINPNLKTFGIAFDLQQSNKALPLFDSDSSLDFVVTNKFIIE